MEKKDRKEKIVAYKERKIVGGVFIIKNIINGKMLILTSTDLYGCKNRFEFSQKTGSCVYMKLQSDWKKLGGEAFTFEILEKLEKKDTQTPKEFKEDIKVLEEIWLEKLGSHKLY
ncbi:GIY-YIG nuclease family protein [Maledivibacter halophilus]|uniref:Uncharacterized protein n=1 Tax=Maledivibacter halophilus TaxID=36842 RepID=A0A1T5L837_9FIRM|nr:GIY-YIG nuclease family protein [Maledivibacter halophilus]SKC72104.1 hypothetical protein SAMN02194393_02564 [Maledivibacter halophilus]